MAGTKANPEVAWLGRSDTKPNSEVRGRIWWEHISCNFLAESPQL